MPKSWTSLVDFSERERLQGKLERNVAHKALLQVLYLEGLVEALGLLCCRLAGKATLLILVMTSLIGVALRS